MIMECIKVRGHRGDEQYPLFTIVLLLGSGNYTEFYLANGRRMLVAKTLKTFQQLPGFVRISKQCMVNTQFIYRVKRFDRKTARVTMSSGIELEIARRRIDTVLEQVENPVRQGRDEG
jgi:two-component system LytT family response regulator